MAPPNLLNDDGSASVATMLMMSHHGFRRDLARFARALDEVAAGETSRIDALREEWGRFRATLHGHHEAEDNGLFPTIRQSQGSLAAVIDRLGADHRRVDALLARGDAAFAELPRGEAAVVVTELRTLLDEHLAIEEAELVPHLRTMAGFPPVETDAELDVYAQGFAWSAQGIAPDVLERVFGLLPERLVSRLPAARAEFDARCRRAWGSAAAGSARTPIPNG